MRSPACALALVLLVACAATPPHVGSPRTVEPPGAWTAGTREGPDRAISDRWWEDLGDPRLTAIVLEALRRNPALDEAAARIRTASALSAAAGADRLPHLAASAQAGRQRQFVGETPVTDPTRRSDRYGVSLNIGWEVDLWGRIRSGQAAAMADTQVEAALYHGARLSVAARTSKAHLTVVESRLQLTVARANLASAADLAGRVRERFEQGLRQAVDVRLADSDVASARAFAHRREQTHDLARRQLETLAGRYPAGRAEAAADLPAVPGPAPVGVPADVLSRRPDLVAAERRLAGATARVAEAEASRYPRISLTGSRGLASDELADILGGDFGVWSLVGNLAAPLFEGGRLRADVDVRTARRDQARAAFASAALTAFLEVETALASEGYLEDQVVALERFVREARAGVSLTEARYLTGLASILAVLEARRRHLDARSALLAVKRQRLTARIDLYVALGGGFRRDRVDAPTEES